jgi:hypothetical protein
MGRLFLVLVVGGQIGARRSCGVGAGGGGGGVGSWRCGQSGARVGHAEFGRCGVGRYPRASWGTARWSSMLGRGGAVRSAGSGAGDVLGELVARWLRWELRPVSGRLEQRRGGPVAGEARWWAVVTARGGSKRELVVALTCGRADFSRLLAGFSRSEGQL